MPTIKPKSSQTIVPVPSGNTGVVTTPTPEITTGTHTHTIADVANLPASLAAKANIMHSHTASDIPGLNTTLSSKADITALSTKANLVHTHQSSDITGIADLMSAKANTTHTHDSNSIVGLNSILNSKADVTALNNKSTIGHSHVANDITDLPALLNSKASAVHSHDMAAINGLQNELSTINAKLASIPTSTSIPAHTHEIPSINGLPTRLSTIESDVAVLKAAAPIPTSVGTTIPAHTHEIPSINGLAPQLATITSNISANTSAIATLNAGVNATNASVSAHTTAISSINTITTSNTVATNTVSADLATLTSKVGYTTGNVTVKQDIDNLKISTVDTATKVSALTARVMTLETSGGGVAIQLPQNVSIPIVTGTVGVNQILSSTTGTWNNTPTSYSYQWYKRTSGVSSAIATAKLSTYSIQTTDIGSSIYCSVTANNSAGTASSSSIDTAIVTAAPSVSTNPVITGSSTVGSILTVSNGIWSGAPTFAYQWMRGSVTITSAIGNSYTVVIADANQAITCKVIATNTAGFTTAVSNSISIIATPSVISLPTISGGTSVDSVLSVTNGTWTNTPTSYAYQWKKNGVAISAATTNTYTAKLADIGAMIVCDVSANNTAGTSTATSNNTITIVAAQVLAPVCTTNPVITGSTIVGAIVNCSTGTWTNSPTGYAYQWLRNNTAIANATNATYTSTIDDIGQSIICTVSATNNAGKVTANSSNAIIIGNPSTVITPTTPAGSNPVTYAITGTRTFNVGTGQAYADMDTVPWGSLLAGDVVNIFYRATPYTHNIIIFGVGTINNKILINGVTDANGNRPQINLAGSRSAAGSTIASPVNYPEYGEALGGIVVKCQRGPYDGPKPEYVIIKNLEIFGGGNGSKFNALNGSVFTRSGCAGVWLHNTKNCTVENCLIYDNAFGVFVQAKNDILLEANENVTLRNNRIYGNGVVNSYLEHNVYMQSSSPLIEGNYIGPLRAGANGSSYKSRSSGEIFRYNYVEAMARGIDFVHAEEQDNGIRAQPDYRYIHCYGNIILNEKSTVCIHVGGDNGGEDSATGPLISPGADFGKGMSLWYRNQLYFYNNTYITKSNYASLFDLSLAGGQTLVDGTVEQRTRVDAWNNIFYTTGTNCSWVESVGSLFLRGNNIVAGNIPATSKGQSTRVNVEQLGTNIVPGNINFIDEAKFNFGILGASSAINTGSATPAGLPSTFQNYPVLFQPYGPKTNGMLTRTAVGTVDIGAYEFGISSSAVVVTPPVSSAPTNSVLPLVSGNNAIGSTLSCSTGNWSNSPTSYGYVWKRGSTIIANANASTYTTTSGDIGQTITCAVTAGNTVGTNTAVSSNGVLITAIIATPIPANTTAPAITGTSTIGSTLSCSNGIWSNSPTGYSYQWKRSGINITNATTSSYITVTADVGNTITCVVTAVNNTGSASMASGNSILVAVVVVVTPPLPPSVPPSIGTQAESNPVTSAITGGRTFNVGPNQLYPDPNTVPWSTLVAGDVVNIFYRATPYNHIIAIQAQGTASNKVIINGVTDSNGNRPVFDYTNGAVVASGTAGIWGTFNTSYGFQRLGGITVINGAGTQYLVDTPKWIEIKNLEIRGAYTGNSSGTSKGTTIKLLDGSTATWHCGAGIHLQSSEDTLIENCVLADNTFGVFTMAKGDLLWYTNLRVTLRNNRIYGNGVVGEWFQHNVYMQSTNPIIEGNYIGKLRAGANGSSYKSRASGEIFRYNWVETHARACDFVHSEEQVNGIAAQPNYKYVHCYGNVIVNDSNVGEFATNPIHFGGDNGGEDGYDGDGTHFDKLVSPGSNNSTPIQLIYREQLFFYNNTVIHNGNGAAYTAAHIFDLSLAGGNVGTAGYIHPRTRVDAWNNVFYTANIDIMTWVEACGAVNLRGNNYLFGTVADHESQRPDWVAITKENIIAGAPNFQAFSTCNYKPTASSPFLDKGITPTGLPTTFQNYPVLFQPLLRTNGMKARTIVGNSIDLGAFEIEDNTLPSITTLPSVSGNKTVGSTLTASTGVWTNSPTFGYQWLRNGVAIAGQTANVYTTTVDDNGTNISVRITATSNGKVSSVDSGNLFVGNVVVAPAVVVSQPTVVVQPAPNPAPTSTSSATTTSSTEIPTIIGVPSIGQKLYCSVNSASPITAISYKWFADGAELMNEQMIFYTVKANDTGKVITCKTIIGGAASVASNSMTIGNVVAQTGVYSFSQVNGSTIGSVDSKWTNSPDYYVIKDGYVAVTDIAKSYGGDAIYNNGSVIKTVEVAIINGITSLFTVGLSNATEIPYDVRISPTSVQIRKSGIWQTDIPIGFDTSAIPVIVKLTVDNGKYMVDINNIRFYTATETNIPLSSVTMTITATTATTNRLDYFRVI